MAYTAATFTVLYSRLMGEVGI